MAVIEKIFRLLFLLILSFQTFQSISQDRIFKIGGDIIQAFNLEISIDTVKYQLFKDPKGLFNFIGKENIAKIIYHDGRTEIFVSTLKEPALYRGQTRNALKMNFLSPFFGYTQFGYERSLKPGRSIEITFGIIGLGINQDLKYKCTICRGRDTLGFKRAARGVNMSIGYKFIKIPDFLKRDIGIAHVLQGTYLKPTLYGGLYNENIINKKSQNLITEVRSVAYAAIMLELGKQWRFNERFLLDLYFGIGRCFDNIQQQDNTFSNYSTEVQAFHFNILRTGKSLALSGGIKIGMIF